MHPSYILVLDIVSKVSISKYVTFDISCRVERVFPSIPGHPRVWFADIMLDEKFGVSNIEIVSIVFFVDHYRIELDADIGIVSISNTVYSYLVQCKVRTPPSCCCALPL